jgi:hypothetical protein
MLAAAALFLRTYHHIVTMLELQPSFRSAIMANLVNLV